MEVRRLSYQFWNMQKNNKTKKNQYANSSGNKTKLLQVDFGNFAADFLQ